MNAKELSEYIENKYPLSNAMEEDFVGLQIDSKKDNIESILICLDPTLDIIKKSISNNIDMIISHHPLFFGDKNELIENDKNLKLKYEILRENNIAYYSLHTNLDFSYDGLSVWQAHHIGMGAIRPLISETNEGAYGILKIKKEKLISILKSKFDLSSVNAYFHKNSFTKIAIGSGSSGYLLNQAIKERCDVLISGEVKWHEWVFAKEQGISMIEIGHFTESIYINKMKNIMKSQVKNVISFENDNIYKNY